MFSLEETRADFYSALKSLKTAHTQKELDIVKVRVNEAKERLLAVDLEFRTMIEERKRESKIRADQMRAEHREIMAETKQKANAVRFKVEALRREADSKREEVAKQYKFETRTHEEAEEIINDKLICPICRGPDRGNIMNGEPYCFGCMHKLVPKSELKNYNRVYRRNWKKR